MKLAALVTTLALCAGARAARADTNDLVMSRLAVAMPQADGTTLYVPQNVEFRSLASQLGVVLAPHMLTPADTIGYGGFQFTVDMSQTSIDNSADYWKARQGVDPSTGAGGSSSMQTVGVFVRKGIWLPVPSFEVGVGAVHLANSNIWAGQFYGKLALIEGYHELPLPSLSVRGGVSRMMNERELDLTVASLDVLLSKHFGIGGTWRLEPFAGWNLLMIIPRSEVIDPTPGIDPLNPQTLEDAKANFVFKDQENIYRQRVVVGSKFRYHVLELTLELTYATAGHSVDNRRGDDACVSGTSMTAACDATDQAKAQTTLSLAAGFEL
jgi:hypothetical protein